MRTWAAIGLVAMLGSQPANAQTFDAARLAGFCTETHAFGQKFGDGRLENAGRILSSFGNRQAFDPRGDAAPFTDFQAGLTLKSKKLHSVQATAVYKTAAEAIAVFDAMEAALTASGKFNLVEVGEREHAASGFVGQKTSYRTWPDAEPPVGLLIDLRLYARVKNESTVVMDCTEQAVYRRGEGEAF